LETPPQRSYPLKLLEDAAEFIVNRLIDLFVLLVVVVFAMAAHKLIQGR